MYNSMVLEIKNEACHTIKYMTLLYIILSLKEIGCISFYIFKIILLYNYILSSMSTIGSSYMHVYNKLNLFI